MLYVSICIPMFIWLAGIITAIVRWRRAPQKSILVLVGLSIMLLGGVNELVRNFLNMNIDSTGMGMGMPTYFNIIRISAFAGVFFDTIGWILCLIAIFIPEKKATQSES